MLVHLTVIPVLLVNASRAALGGAGFIHATVIVTPLVWVEPPVVPPPVHPVSASPRATAPAMTAFRVWRLGLSVIVLLLGRWERVSDSAERHATRATMTCGLRGFNNRGPDNRCFRSNEHIHRTKVIVRAVSLFIG